MSAATPSTASCPILTVKNADPVCVRHLPFVQLNVWPLKFACAIAGPQNFTVWTPFTATWVSDGHAAPPGVLVAVVEPVVPTSGIWQPASAVITISASIRPAHVAQYLPFSTKKSLLY